MLEKQCEDCLNCEITKNDAKRFGNIKITKCEYIRNGMDKKQHYLFDRGQCPFFNPKHFCRYCSHLIQVEDEIDGVMIKASNCNIMKAMPSINILENGECDAFEPIRSDDTNTE